MQCGEDNGKKIGSAQRLIALGGPFARISSVPASKLKQTSADFEKKTNFPFSLNPLKQPERGV